MPGKERGQSIHVTDELWGRCLEEAAHRQIETKKFTSPSAIGKEALEKGLEVLMQDRAVKEGLNISESPIGAPAYKCPFDGCGRGFESEQALAIHVSRMHKKDIR